MAAELKFPALRGRMGDREFYLLVMPLRQVARFFETTPSGIPPEQRAQRPLNERRVPEIVNYLLGRENDWVFGSLTASYDGDADFQVSKESPNIGHLAMDPGTEFVIVDGQHRLAAIQAALRENPTLGQQNIGVMLLPYEDLDRNQQIFSDLNRTVQKTSRSLDILYDHSDPLNEIVMTISTRVPLFQNRVEKGSQSLALRSPKFVTLSSLYDGCQQLLGGDKSRNSLSGDDRENAAEELCARYWNYLSEIIEPWRDVQAGHIRPAEARTEFVIAHSVAFYALGAVGAKVLAIESAQDWTSTHDFSLLDGLSEIDWGKTNKDWQGIVMLGHQVVTRRQTRIAMAQYICHKLDPAKFDAPQKVVGD
jgi:DNA sulfur modification protein DndB